MIKKPYALAILLLLTAVLFSTCVVEYDFDRAPQWLRDGTPISRNNASGSAEGYGGVVTVTLNLVNGYIENVRIDGRHETPSYARVLIQTAERTAAVLNSFDFLDGMTGSTITRNAIRDAGRGALRAAGANL